MSSQSSFNDGDRRQPPTDGRPTAPVYEMLPIDTDAARAEASALAEDRARLLAGQGIAVSADRTRDLLREPGALGLYEDGILVGALVLHRDPDMRHWGADGRDPGLLVSLDPSTVGSNQVGRLLTLWLADHAASSRLMWVWCEVPFNAGPVDEASQWLLKYLRDLGWETRSPVGLSPTGERVRLRLRAEARPALSAAISDPYAGASVAVRAP
ncbi:hypothetical protein OG883_41465 [Streptomyces sp. NBC_01142]|uniref:hypothetical protein n=1 Tax=Streptomyces sp. NBC_01142 TaxID=2975865 RepID=UPI00224ECAFA|nr:hypothetical protein [Streptomyces sp. NBC_01142]MCX4826142.1 hypothetical protein [Streptomyces sp. NBC_01142]